MKMSKKYAVINKKTKIVENIILADLEYRRLYSRQHKEFRLVECDSEEITIGFKYNSDGAFTKDDSKIYSDESIHGLRMVQFRTQLYLDGLIEKVEEFSRTSPEFIIYWEYESIVNRYSNFVINLMIYLKFTKEQEEEFFNKADKIK